MRDFMRQNWIYVALPLGIVILAIVALVLFGDSPESNFNYPL